MYDTGYELVRYKLRIQLTNICLFEEHVQVELYFFGELMFV